MKSDQPTNILILQPLPGEKPRGHKLTVIVREMKKHIRNGHTVYLKWTCEKCKQRATANEPNRVSRLMHHEECDHISDLAHHKDVNFLLEMRNLSLEDVQRYFKGKV